MLGASRELGLQVRIAQVPAERVHDLVDQRFALTAAHLQHPRDLGVLGRVVLPEGLVLKLPAPGPHPEPSGQRRVELERFLADVPDLGRPQRGHGPDVVQAVGEFYDHDPDVARHRKEHLAHRQRPLALDVVKVQAGQLGHAVDELGDFAAEPLADQLRFDPAVLLHVVQQPGHDGVHVHAQFGQQHRHRQRV